MERISKSLADAGERYGIVVVGSGYGGGVAASRLARAGQKVCVLERGREMLPGEYPATPVDLVKETQVSSDTEHIGDASALFDLRVGSDMAVLVGCGLGGTSLINANVALDADMRVLHDDGWPKALNEGPDALTRQHYDRARAMLGSTPYPDDFPKLRKLAALEASAKGLGKKFYRPPINVTFKDGPNAAGVQQVACKLCGDCVTGCNYGAKNTTLMNYLPDAAKHGAQIFTGAKVLWVERADDLWKVVIEDQAHGSPAAGRQVLVREILAETVILAAGTLGSTEILLRSREKGLTTSVTLGRGFSGNGDTLGFAYNCAVDATAPVRAPIYGIGSGNLWSKKPESEALRPGPCITGIIDMRDEGNARNGMVIEDGVLPSGLALVYPPMFLFASALSAGQPRFVDEAARLKDAQFLAEGVQKGMEDPAPFTYEGPVSRTQTFLVMSHEGAAAPGGELSLEGDRLKISFPGVGDLPVFARNDRVLQKASEAVRGNYVSNPLWSRSSDRQLISVHPLGGCQMGEIGKTGVVNDRCQVFTGSGPETHDGLYVCDGSVIRGSLGVNPLLTISAISERAMELLARDKHWVIDYASRKVSPEKRAAVPAGAPATSRPALPARTDWPEVKQPTDAQRAKKSRWSKIARAFAALGPLASAILAGDWGRAFDIFNENFCDISPGMRFSERMRGPFSVKVQRDEEKGKLRISNPFELAARRATADGDIMEVEFDVGVASLHELINRPEHAAALKGTIAFQTLAAEPMTIDGGRLELLIDDPTNVETWLMVYSGVVQSGRRGKLHFEGRKTLRGRTGAHWWTDVTTLFVTMREESANGIVVGRGIVRLRLQDFVKQAQTTSVAYDALNPTGETGSFCRRIILCILRRVWPGALDLLSLLSASKLASFFAERIIRAHGGILPYLQNYPAIANAKRKQDMATDPQSKRVPAPPRRYEIRTEDNKTLALTRFTGGSKGPLIVAPGIGVTAASYALNTVDVNFVEYFSKAGYDVWLFDYRASPALPTSKEKFTVDDIVKYDWPAAVKVVLDNTKAKDVQVLGHCVGSLSLLMALLNDLKGVRSAICSQFSLHPVTHWFNYAKIDMDVVGLLEGGLAKYLGTNLPLRREAVDGITKALGKLLPGGLPKNLVEGFPYVDMRSYGTTDDQALDALLWDVPMPPQDHCKNPVCHRMFMVYGLALNHEHINEATHNALEDIFGPISSHLFNQLKLIMDLGRAVDKDGQDSYLVHPERLTMPITLLSGSRNRILMPESTQRTLEWMREANPENASKYSRHVFPAYAHMDLFIGKNADRDIFPFIEKTLDAGNP